MKPAAPEILRKGAVVRIAGATQDATQPATAWATAFVDLRFDDGHVERWRGAGSLRDDPSYPLHYADIMEWATDTAEEHELIADLEMSFSNVDRDALRDAPVEIVFEWNATMPSVGLPRSAELGEEEFGAELTRAVDPHGHVVVASSFPPLRFIRRLFRRRSK